MKILLTIATVAVISISTLAQGTIAFNTRVIGQVDAPITWSDGRGIGEVVPGINAQLFLVTPAGGSAVYTPLTPATTFFTSGAASRYVVVPNSNVIVPTVGAGQQATVVMRIFEGASYDAAALRGETAPITITLGGQPATGAPLQPALLTGLQGFTVPEPSTIALGVLGAAALLFRRRK